MTSLNGNNGFLSIDGTDISGYFTKAEFDEMVGVEDISAGAGLEHEMLAPKLRSTNFKATIAYDITNVSSHVSLIQPGTHTVVWGPEGNGAGKPKQNQSVIIASCKQSPVQVDKAFVTWELTGRGAAVATESILAGDTF